VIAADGSPAPEAFTARTRMVYGWPLVSPATTADLASGYAVDRMMVPAVSVAVTR
jgi:hypothetical protein